MSLESYVDVLIIGAGPAGLMCANALAIAGTRVRIIDKRPAKVTAGQADGIQPRTIEVLQNYGLAERVIREGNQIHMSAFYVPSSSGGIEYTGRSSNIIPFTSTRYPFGLTLHQGAIEAVFLDAMKDHGVEVERPCQPVDIQISKDIDELSNPSSYPVKVTLAHLDMMDNGREEIVYAKFVVGTDGKSGAHSWVRKALGIEMEGDQTDHAWGVVDLVPETNFPDIRKCSHIRSENGSCMIVPREGDTVRFYTQLSDVDVMDPTTRRVDKSKLTPQKIVSVTQQILHPFQLAYPKEIQWWTVYIIGQRVASSYSVKNRVFIAGDACHTHSPKAGQGMNASMHDTHNLAWKLVQVLRGWSSMSLLETYEHERRKYAQDLIAFDKEYATLCSRKPRTAVNTDGVTQEQFLQSFQTHAEFKIGIGVYYSPSAIVDPKHQKYANKLTIGQRMPPQIFVRAADTRPVDIQDLLPADARFKVLFFVGNLTEACVSELKLLAEQLSKPTSFLRKYSHDGNVSTVFDVLTIAAGKKEDINYLFVPAFLRSHWTKVLLDDTDVTGSKGGHGYEQFEISPGSITVVVVRPDGHVGAIAPSRAIADLDSYFGSFLLGRGYWKSRL